MYSDPQDFWTKILITKRLFVQKVFASNHPSRLSPPRKAAIFCFKSAQNPHTAATRVSQTDLTVLRSHKVCERLKQICVMCLRNWSPPDSPSDPNHTWRLSQCMDRTDRSIRLDQIFHLTYSPHLVTACALFLPRHFPHIHLINRRHTAGHTHKRSHDHHTH